MSWISAGYCDGCYDSYCDGCYDSHYDSYCNGRYNGQDGCCDGCCDCGYDSTTKARPKGSKDKELRKRRQKATGVILRPLAAKKASMPTVHSFKGFMIAQMIFHLRVKIGEIAPT